MNPAGRTVQTWVKDITDLPDMMDYDIRNGRTYMYHQGPVLYPFGYGLSYSDFAYEKIESVKQDKKNIRVTDISEEYQRTRRRTKSYSSMPAIRTPKWNVLSKQLRRLQAYSPSRPAKPGK